MEKEEFFDKYLDKMLLVVFIIVFLFSYSYKLGGFYYDIIPWVFFGGMFIAFASIIGILMFPLALIYQTLFYYKLQFLPMAFTSVFTLVIVGILAFMLIMKKEHIKKDTNMYLIITLGLAAFLSTTFNGLLIGIGNSEFTHYIEAVLIFFVITIMISSKKRLRLFNWMLLFAIGSLALRMYNHTYTYDYAILGFENNYLARVFSFYIPFFIGFFWAEREKYLKFIIVLVLAVTLQSITQLGSRATYLALGLTLPFLFLINYKKKSTWTFATLGIIFLLFFTPSNFFEDIESITYAKQGTESEEVSIQGRFLVAEQGWETFKEQPIIGYGVYPDRFENLMLQRYGWYKSGHNAFIIIAVQMGIFGLLAYLLLFGFSIYYCFKTMRATKKKDPYLYYLSQGTMFGVIALGINQAMLNNPWIPTAFIAFGLSSVLYYLAQAKTVGKFKVPKIVWYIALFIAILTIIFFFIFLVLNLIF